MRARLRSGRDRAMARRPGEPRALVLSPRARRIAGWVAAVALVAGIALGVRLIGGSGDGSPTEPVASGTAVDTASITFGTLLDPATGLVATASRTQSFERADTFAYSVADVAPEPSVDVEVERIAGGVLTVVQHASPQSLAPGAATIAFSVPAEALVDAFGPGEYRMRIYRARTSQPLAEGTFTLVGTLESPAR